jgi:hypothetical protein
MSVRYDDKGKYYTDVIIKDRIPSIIQTSTHQIRGNLHIRIDERVKDELNQGEKFAAITDAEIFDLHGKKKFDAEFMLINRDRVIWIIPDEDKLQTDQPSED